jgi:glutamate synthase (NADPH/NADH) small chain
MGNPRGFIEIARKEAGYRPPRERVTDFSEVEKLHTDAEALRQASRCMDCGIPFCHGYGCPLCNVVPEINDMIYDGRWKEALETLLSTNRFPEFTGRVCPALCEAACTVGIDGGPVTIRQLELWLVEKGYAENYIIPNPPRVRSGKKVAVVGSGPAGLAAADTLNRLGHSVTVFEREKFAGGLLRYGIPDFKLDKKVVQRKVSLMTAEGIVFETGVSAGSDISAKFLTSRFDAVCLAMGAKAPRGLNIPGADLGGVIFAMDFLSSQNKACSGEAKDAQISAAGKNVLVIGGGDTGSDCVGTSIRHGAKNVIQIEIMPQPPEDRHSSTPWPQWPYQLRTSSSHKEGCERMWSITTKKLTGKSGKVSGAELARVEWETDAAGRPVKMTEVPGSGFSVKADLVLLAMGFTGPEKGGVIEQFGLEIDKRGNVSAGPDYMSSVKGVFGAGDVISGASLVVRALNSGNKMADSVDRWLLNR